MKSIMNKLIPNEFDFEKARKQGNLFLGDIYIESGTQIGKNNIFYNGCHIKSSCTIGDNNVFQCGVSIGSPSREKIMGTSVSKKITDSPRIVIGNFNLFEDYVSVQLPLEETTQIGNRICIGAYSHVSHDSIIQDNVVAASHCAIGGYSIIQENVNIGMGACIHQRSVIGGFAMIGAGCVVINHISPGATVVGVPSRFLSVNKIGLQRYGASVSEILEIENWLRNSTYKGQLPDFMIKQINSFKNNLKKWNRNKEILPKVFL